MRNCKKPISRATATITAGASVVVTFPTAVTTPEFGQCYSFVVEGDLSAMVGTEEVAINIAGTDIPIVDNCGLFITAQMLRRALADGCAVRNPVYRVQFGAATQGGVFYARRGFAKRRTTVATTTVTIPPATEA